MPRKKAKQGSLTVHLNAMKITPKQDAVIERVRARLSIEAGHEITKAEAVRRLMLWGEAAEPKAPQLAADIDEVLP